ncbi:MAG TPA: ECF-type sigma factor, partial [Gemmatales bacterium]|nr:ECF-type sigma factor [Gemmatales bacterium]
DVRLVARKRLGPALRPYLDSIDLVQSVQRSLIRGLRDQRFDWSSPEQLIALAVTMVRRKAARAWRKFRRQQRLTSSDSDGLPELLAGLAADSDPAAEVANRDAIDRLCADLSPLDRDLLERSLLGFRTVDIARDLGLNADVLRVRLSRLRQRLRSAGLADEVL